MKKVLGSVLIPLLMTGFIGCKSYGRIHLDKQKVTGAKTALVIDTEFFPSHDVPYNGFNLKCENMSKDECTEVITRLKAVEERERPKLIAYLAGLTRAMLTAKGMPAVGLDRKVFYDSKQFPLKYRGDRYTYCAVSRDFRELLNKGYTHVLYAGFPNRIAYKKKDKKNTALMLFFGIESFMVDLRPELGDMETKGNRVDRLIWCYGISPSMQSSSSSSSYDLTSDIYDTTHTRTHIKTTTYTTTYTTHYRNCLGIALLRRNGTPYTLDELFTGPNPLYIAIYKRAALYGLSFAGQHLAGKDIPREKLKVGVGVDDFIAKVKLP